MSEPTVSEIHLRLSDDPSVPLRPVGTMLPGLSAVVRILAGLTEVLRAAWHRLRCSWRYSVALQELQALDARTLKDIGVNRGDLEAIAYATARRGAFGRFGAVRIRRTGIADLARCVE